MDTNVNTKNTPIKVGDKFSTSIPVTDKMVRQFADLSGDHNPIHLDEEFAKKTRFGRRIAHGMISGALISRCLVDAYGKGIIYLGQALKFTGPVFIDDEVQVEFAVTAIREDKKIATIETQVKKKVSGETVVKGEATIMYP